MFEKKSKTLESILDDSVDFLRTSSLYGNIKIVRPKIKFVDNSKYQGLYAGIYFSRDYRIEIVENDKKHALRLAISHEYFHHVQTMIGYSGYLWKEMSRYDVKTAAFIRGFEESSAEAFAVFYEANRKHSEKKKVDIITFYLKYKWKQSLAALEALHDGKLSEYMDEMMKEEKSDKKDRRDMYMALIGSAYISRGIALFAAKRNNFDFFKTMMYLTGDIYTIMNDIRTSNVSELKVL